MFRITRVTIWEDAGARPVTLVLRADHDLAEDSDEDELWEEDSDEAMEGRRQRFADEALRRAGLVRRLPLRSQAGWPSPPSAPARGRLSPGPLALSSSAVLR